MKVRRYRFPDTMTTLEMEELKSQMQRSWMLVVLFTIILVVSVLNFFFLDNSVAQYYGGVKIYFTVASWGLLFVAYQVCMLLYLKRKFVAGQKTTLSFKLVHTVVETAFPTAIVVYMIWTYKMLIFLDSPATLVYFLFIVLSVLHLDFRVNIFAGVLSAVQYVAIVYYGYHYVDVPAGYWPTTPENSHYLRAVIFMLCGGAAAFVSGELKRRVLATFESLQARNELELLFGQHVSKEVSRALIDEKGASKRMDATIMFLDIRNFTLFADTHTADEVVEYQNKFLAPVIDQINQHQGVVLQILGDGLLACFGAPVANVLHADMAFQASVNIIRSIRKASEKGEIYPTTVGIGLHCGQIIAGNIGNEQRKQFSITGTPVIMAARLEQLNKKYKTELLISGDVHARVTPGKIKLEYMDEEPLRGIEKPVKIYAAAL